MKFVSIDAADGGTIVVPVTAIGRIELARGPGDVFDTEGRRLGEMYTSAAEALADNDVIIAATAGWVVVLAGDDESRQLVALDREAGLVRAADLVGQLADPAYPRKLAALYCEFRETGVAERLGYRDPADLAEQYPRFFWGKVEPHIGPALRHLERTADGRLWVAQLYAHVFVEEHVRHRLGTDRGGGAAGELRVVAGEAEAPVARRQVPS